MSEERDDSQNNDVRNSAQNEPLEPAAPESLLVRIFFRDRTQPGLRGARSGWRAVLYVLMAVAVLLVLGTIAHFLGLKVPKGVVSPWFLFANEITLFAAAYGVSLIMARLEHRDWNEYGMPVGKAFRGAFWTGVPWGVGALALLLGLMKLAGVFSFGHVLLSGPALVGYALVWFAGFTLVGLTEEFLLRGYLQYTLTEGITFWPAAVLLSVLFGSMHGGNHGEDIVGLFSAGLIGLFFCFTLYRTGNLWFAVGLHAGWDWGESYLFGTADSGMVSKGRLMEPVSHGSKLLSGGSVGPEGSVLVFVVIAVLFVAFHFACPRRKVVSDGA